MRRTILCGLMGALFVLASLVAAGARPQYAAKEGKTCTFCHVKPSGGMPLTAAGQYYRGHGHSLKGYKAAPAKPGAKPKTPAKGKPGAKPKTTPKPKPGAKPKPRGDDDDKGEHHRKGHRERDDD